jgi:hypothetical protein
VANDGVHVLQVLRRARAVVPIHCKQERRGMSTHAACGGMCGGACACAATNRSSRRFRWPWRPE